MKNPSAARRRSVLALVAATPFLAACGAVDASGSVYVAGFTGTPPERGDLQDALVVRYAADGTLLWTLPFGSSVNDLAHGIALDANGNVYVAGYTEGALDGPNAGVLDVFVMRIDGG